MTTQDVVPLNQDYLDKAIVYLTTANHAQALEFYEATYRTKGCTNWLIARLGQEDLFFLLAFLLRRPDISRPWLYERCREVEASPDGHLDLWARFHYKSTIITFGLTIQDILRDPDDTFGIFSHNRPGAKSFLRQIKVEFEENELLKTLYPDVLYSNPREESPKWSEDEGIVVKRKGNPKESTVEAWGLIDGMPTGKHFKKRVYDDIVTETSVTTPDMMAKVTQKVELSYALGTEDGIERWVGTRYHFNDSYRTLIDRKSVNVRMYDGTIENSGDIKRPALWEPEFMATMRKKMGIYTFGTQILQNPKGDESQGFREEWLERWTPDDGKGLNKYILRDPARSKKESADYTVDWVVGLGPDENYYILAVYRDRLNLTERTNRLFELHKKWKPLEVRYEEYGLQADIEHIEAEMDRVKYRFKITKVAGQTRKEDRIKRLVPLFENHRIILPRSFHVTTSDGETKDMIHEFVETEYKAFPVPIHDDMLDALARIAEPELKLKWPAAPQFSGKVVPHTPLDAEMGM